MIFRSLLERIIAAEDNPQAISEEEFAKLRLEISTALSKGHQLRLKRLSFFASEPINDYLDDIPF